MSVIGTVESLWRYPVKSMRGEELREVFIGLGGLAGDRLFAFRSSAAPPDFPYFTARQQHRMLQYRPRILPNEPSVEVESPSGKTFGIEDPNLIEELRDGAGPEHQVTLMRSDRALADAHPVSLLSLQTVRAISDETGIPAEKRRFRASIYLDLPEAGAFAEDQFVGHAVRIGPELVVNVIKRDARCVMTNLHPDTVESTPAVLKNIAQAHAGCLGVYGDVLHEGLVCKGDSVELLPA